MGNLLAGHEVRAGTNPVPARAEVYSQTKLSALAGSPLPSYLAVVG